jgi:hypothetical protein
VLSKFGGLIELSRQPVALALQRCKQRRRDIPELSAEVSPGSDDVPPMTPSLTICHAAGSGGTLLKGISIAKDRTALILKMEV